MKPIVYNTSVILGVILVGIGVGIHDLGAGLASTGALIVVLTVYVTSLGRRD